MMFRHGVLVAVAATAFACGSPPEASDVDKDFLERRESSLKQLTDTWLESKKAFDESGLGRADMERTASLAVAFAHKVRELRDIMFTGPESKKLETCRDRTWGFFDKLKDLTEPLAEITRMEKREASGRPLRTGEDPVPNAAERQLLAIERWHDASWEIHSQICQLYDVSTMCKRAADKLQSGVAFDLMTRGTLDCR